MGGNLTIVGSGRQGIVDISEGRYLFVNSAVLRSEGDKVIDVIITDGLLSADDELQQAENATGLNAEQSLEMRSSKRKALTKQKIDILYIVSKKNKKELLERLEAFQVNYGSLQIVSRREISKKMLLLCLEHFRFEIGFLMLIFWHLIGCFTTKTIPSKYRPSTGGIAILYSHFIAKNYALDINLDGIGNSDTEAFYPDKSGELIKRQFNNVHHLADQTIIKTSV